MKINQGYKSLFEYLVSKDFPYARALDEKFYPDEHSRLKWTSNVPYGRRYNPNQLSDRNTVLKQQLLGGLQPIFDIQKDISNTFKSYKTNNHIVKDALQPIRGIGNIVKGLANCLGAPLIFLFNIARYASISGNYNNFTTNVSRNFVEASSWFLDGITSIVRGSTQIITTPLTWVLKIPTRLIITAINDSQKIEENQGIQELIKTGEEAVKNGDAKTLDCIRYELHRKFEKAQNLKQETNIDVKKEGELFNGQHFKYGRNYEYPVRDDRKISALLYMGLFSTDKEKQNESLKAKKIESVSWSSVEAYEENCKRQQI